VAAPGAVEYVDRDVHGDTVADERPALARLLADAKAGKIATLTVWRLTGSRAEADSQRLCCCMG